MTGGCPPPNFFFCSCDLDKDQSSNLSMWKNFPTPKVYNCQIWLKASNNKGDIEEKP